jgi:steroid delta-isomerase-like uncharacterized protein
LRALAAADHRADSASRDLEGDREHDCGDHRDHRRIRGARPVGEHERREPPADEGAADQARERESAPDEPLHRTSDRSEHDEGERQPVDDRHERVRLVAVDGSELQEFIDRYNAAWNAHDVAAIVAMHTDDSVFENHVTGDVNVGPEQIGRAISGIFAVFPDLAFETRRAYIREDLVVQEWTARGTHEGTMTRSGIEVQPTGKKVEYRGMDVIPIREGLVARKDVYSDSVTLLRQLGLTAI